MGIFKRHEIYLRSILLCLVHVVHPSNYIGKMDGWTTLFSLPWVISKVLVWGIVISTFIKAITLTYYIIDIYIIIFCIHIPSKYILSTTLRVYMACATTSVTL